jgi:hypothetical protein
MPVISPMHSGTPVCATAAIRGQPSTTLLEPGEGLQMMRPPSQRASRRKAGSGESSAQPQQQENKNT